MHFLTIISSLKKSDNMTDTVVTGKKGTTLKSSFVKVNYAYAVGF